MYFTIGAEEINRLLLLGRHIQSLQLQWNLLGSEGAAGKKKANKKQNNDKNNDILTCVCCSVGARVCCCAVLEIC
jgi:hypothetical protein